jgi:hypothetical protein
MLPSGIDRGSFRHYDMVITRMSFVAELKTRRKLQVPERSAAPASVVDAGLELLQQKVDGEADDADSDHA